MNIFYVNKTEFLRKIDIEELEKYKDNKKYSSKEKYIEHLIGLYLVKNIAKNTYNISNTEIEVINNKPQFKNKNIYFSISHSKDIVAVAFSHNNVGLDVEYIKQRDYKPILERFNIKNENPTLKDFYKFWTKYEAEYKLGVKASCIIFNILENDYMLCLASENDTKEVSIIQYE